MRAILLSDFGSTFTKLTAVDLEHAEILGTASAYTTIETDIQDGYAKALQELEAEIGVHEYTEELACSSAAGGLRMLVSGLVPELTAEAARLAALGAGAKVISVFSHELTEEDVAEIHRLSPDIFLLTGGTDGGNSDCILYNAEVLASAGLKCPIVVAGNRSAGGRVQKLLEGSEVYLCPNVMPKLGVLNIAPVQEKIREIFLKKIVLAKGLSKVQKRIGGILMPTPAAVLTAISLLANGCSGIDGLGEILAVDLGGATTDVYSVADGSPRDMSTVIKGLPEPREKRTVEGDIGMRYSLKGILDASGLEAVAARSGLEASRIDELCTELMTHTDRLPVTDELLRLDDALASTAVEVAVKRHAGMLEEVYTPIGRTYAQTGKDLREIRTVIATGGALIRSPHTQEIVSHLKWDPQDPFSLRPERFEVLIDRKYILSAMGVLAQSQAEIALTILKKELQHE